MQDIGDYKNALLSMVIQSDDILSAMYTDKKVESLSSLIYKQIFPYLYVDDTQTDVLSYICIEADIPRIPTGTTKTAQLSVWAYAHKECMQCDNHSGTRVDVLCDYLDRVIMDEKNRKQFGIGRPQLISVNHFYPQNKYYGRQLIYNIPDFKVKEKNG